MNTSPMTIRRRQELQSLATYLQNYATLHQPPPEQSALFHMNFWYTPLDSLSQEYQAAQSIIQPDQPRLECGYAACAIGHLPYAYPDTQLRLVPQKHYAEVQYTDEAGRLLTDYDAIIDFFNIPYNSVRYLFDPQSYTESQLRDPVYVGQRIQSFLDENPEPLP